jgi:type II secretory pathway predicted ATPase ExeA
MQAVSSREVLIIAAAAAAGAGLTARWWARFGQRPQACAPGSAQHRVDDLHGAFRDLMQPSAHRPEEVLHRQWSHLCRLQLPPSTASPVTPRPGHPATS